MRGFSRISECEDTTVGALAREDGTVYGSGVLVGASHVLTAAHCTEGITPYWFISGGEFFKIRSVTVHPQYKIGEVIFVDLAMLRLDAPCPATPATLPQEGYQLARGDDLTAIGYGGGIRRKSNPGVLSAMRQIPKIATRLAGVADADVLAHDPEQDGMGVGQH
jgi:hypothetical protein